LTPYNAVDLGDGSRRATAPSKLPYLHKNARSRDISRQDILETFAEFDTERKGTGSDPYYDYGNSQGGAAWHAVDMARQARAEDG
jgi:hypothetical protein